MKINIITPAMVEGWGPCDRYSASILDALYGTGKTPREIAASDDISVADRVWTLVHTLIYAGGVDAAVEFSDWCYLRAYYFCADAASRALADHDADWAASRALAARDAVRAVRDDRADRADRDAARAGRAVFCALNAVRDARFAALGDVSDAERKLELAYLLELIEAP